MARSKRSKNSAKKANAALSDAVDAGKDAAAEAADSIESVTGEVVNDAAEAVTNTADSAIADAEVVAEETADAIEETVADATDAASEAAGDTVDAVKDAVDEAADAVEEATGETPEVPGVIPAAADAAPSDTTVQSAPVAPPSPPPAKGGTGGMILGGALAGAIGFGSAWFLGQQGTDTDVTADLQAQVATLTQEIETLRGASADVDLTPITGRLDAAESLIEETSTALGGRIDAVQEQVAAIELPAPSGDATAEVDNSLRESLSGLETTVGTLETTVGTIETTVGTIETTVGTLETTVGTLETTVGTIAEDVSGIQTTVATLQDGMSASESTLSGAVETATALQTGLSGIEERLGVVEANMPNGDAAMEAQLEVFRGQLDEATAEAEARIAAAREEASTIEQQAAQAAAEADRAAAISELKVALENGSPFGDILARVGDVPEQLSASADGVVTLGSLQADFPGLARRALSEVQIVQEDASTGDRLTAFLRRQTNARSLQPRDGDSTDAILSRVEALLAQGDLGSALTEMGGLQGGAAETFSDWTSAAQTRADALAAYDSLVQGSN